MYLFAHFTPSSLVSWQPLDASIGESRGDFCFFFRRVRDGIHPEAIESEIQAKRGHLISTAVFSNVSVFHPLLRKNAVISCNWGNKSGLSHLRWLINTLIATCHSLEPSIDVISDHLGSTRLNFALSLEAFEWSATWCNCYSRLSGHLASCFQLIRRCLIDQLLSWRKCAAGQQWLFYFLAFHTNHLLLHLLSPKHCSSSGRWWKEREFEICPVDLSAAVLILLVLLVEKLLHSACSMASSRQEKDEQW